MGQIILIYVLKLFMQGSECWAKTPQSPWRRPPWFVCGIWRYSPRTPGTEPCPQVPLAGALGVRRPGVTTSTN